MMYKTKHKLGNQQAYSFSIPGLSALSQGQLERYFSTSSLYRPNKCPQYTMSININTHHINLCNIIIVPFTIGIYKCIFHYSSLSCKTTNSLYDFKHFERMRSCQNHSQKVEMTPKLQGSLLSYFRPALFYVQRVYNNSTDFQSRFQFFEVWESSQVKLYVS